VNPRARAPLLALAPQPAGVRGDPRLSFACRVPVVVKQNG